MSAIPILIGTAILLLYCAVRIAAARGDGRPTNFPGRTHTGNGRLEPSALERRHRANDTDGSFLKAGAAGSVHGGQISKS
jgi:hypothetical protein